MSDHSDLSKVQFRDKMIAYEEQLRGDVMTVAEQWKQEGYDRGVVVGIEKGIKRGALEKAKETAKNMLAKGYELILKAVREKDLTVSFRLPLMRIQSLLLNC